MIEMRRVKVVGDQECWYGWFHQWAGLSEHPIAIVEGENGGVVEVDMHKIQFLDRAACSDPEGAK